MERAESAGGGPAEAGQVSRKWRRVCRRVLRRCRGQCEWVRPDVGIRCSRAAMVVVRIVPDGDDSLGNLQGLCSRHNVQKQAQERQAGRHVAIRVRPQRTDDGA